MDTHGHIWTHTDTTCRTRGGPRRGGQQGAAHGTTPSGAVRGGRSPGGGWGSPPSARGQARVDAGRRGRRSALALTETPGQRRACKWRETAHCGACTEREKTRGHGRGGWGMRAPRTCPVCRGRTVTPAPPTCRSGGLCSAAGCRPASPPTAGSSGSCSLSSPGCWTSCGPCCPPAGRAEGGGRSPCPLRRPSPPREPVLEAPSLRSHLVSSAERSVLKPDCPKIQTSSRSSALLLTVS